MDKKCITILFFLLFGTVGISIGAFLFHKRLTERTTKIYCSRKAPYTIPREFTQALQMITQRTASHFQTNNPFSFLPSFTNCLDIQYADVSQAAEYVLYDAVSSTPTHVKIYVDYSYPFHDTLITAFLLANRVWRAESTGSTNVSTCDVQEANVKKAEAFFVASLIPQQRHMLTTENTRQDQREQNVLQSVRFALDETNACGHKPHGCSEKDISDYFMAIHVQAPPDTTECTLSK